MLDKVSDKPVSLDGGPDELSMYRAVEQPQPKKRSAFWSFIGNSLLALIQGALMIAIIFGAVYAAKKMIEEKPEPRKRRAFKTVYTIETVTAKQSDYRPVFSSFGQTVAARSVDLRALVSGEIVKVNPRLRAGARVEKGASLIEIDQFDYRGALSEARANLAEANAKVTENDAQIALEKSKLEAAKEQLKFAEIDVERMEKLVARRTSTQQQLEARKLIVSQRRQAVALSEDMITVQQAKADQLKASIERLEWRVEQAERNVRSTTLVAPFSGIVRSSNAEIGRAITANDVVVSMYEEGQLEVRFTLSDARFGRLQTSETGLVGREIEVVWSVGGNDWKYPATIDRVGAEITSNRGGVEVYAKVGEADNAVTIRPGAFVEVRVPDKVFKDAIAIPDTSVYGTDTVYTSVDGKLVEKKVTIAAYEGETALITAGLASGDEVLVTRITEVSEGLSVQSETDAAKQAANAGAAPRTGRPTPEELAEIAKANGMTMEALRGLDQAERRKLVQAHRAASK